MASELPMRLMAEGEREAVGRVQAVAFGSRWEPGRRDVRFELTSEPDRVLVVEDPVGATGPYAFAGTGAAVGLELSVPGGGSLPTCGIRGIGVLPTHRRRGLLARMMRWLLDDARERGESLSILWPTESAIYGRYGYAPGMPGMRVELAARGAAFRAGATVGSPIGFATIDEAHELLPPVYERARFTRPGMAARDERWWGWRLYDPDGNVQIVVAHGPGGQIDGYARYGVSASWGPQGPDNSLHVHELVGVTPVAAASLWRFVLDVDLITKVTAWNRPVDEALPLLLAEPRRLQRSVHEGAWVRVLDVAPAMSQRSYAAEGRVVIEVRDSFCPWNEGRWALEGGPDGATCKATDEPAGIVLGAEELGAAYLGATAVRSLCAAGRVDEERPGAVDELDRMLSWPTAPWSVTWF